MSERSVLILGFAATVAMAVLPFAGIANAARTPEQVYGAVCHDCHDTGVGPVILGKHIPAAQVKSTVRNGGLQMPPIGSDVVSDAELDALAEWVSDHQ